MIKIIFDIIQTPVFGLCTGKLIPFWQLIGRLERMGVAWERARPSPTGRDTAGEAQHGFQTTGAGYCAARARVFLPVRRAGVCGAGPTRRLLARSFCCHRVNSASSVWRVTGLSRCSVLVTSCRP